MFAGIVEGVGTVVSVRPGVRGSAEQPWAVRLEIDAGGLLVELKPGASVAVNGCCLTLLDGAGETPALPSPDVRGGMTAFDVIAETWRRTNLRHLRPGDHVNLERSLRLGDRVDGHFVQGHVDGVGTVQRVDRGGGEWILWTAAPRELMRYIVRKGSIAIDGTSLTVVDVRARAFSVALIPTTLEKTVLGRRRPGDAVNLETDILARLVVDRLESLAAGGSDPAGRITWQRLRESGLLT
jgi:riboflavin synthase